LQQCNYTFYLITFSNSFQFTGNFEIPLAKIDILVVLLEMYGIDTIHYLAKRIMG